MSKGKVVSTFFDDDDDDGDYKEPLRDDDDTYEEKVTEKEITPPPQPKQQAQQQQPPKKRKSTNNNKKSTAADKKKIKLEEDCQSNSQTPATVDIDYQGEDDFEPIPEKKERDVYSKAIQNPISVGGREQKKGNEKLAMHAQFPSAKMLMNLLKAMANFSKEAEFKFSKEHICCIMIDGSSCAFLDMKIDTNSLLNYVCDLRTTIDISLPRLIQILASIPGKDCNIALEMYAQKVEREDGLKEWIPCDVLHVIAITSTGSVDETQMRLMFLDIQSNTVPDIEDGYNILITTKMFNEIQRAVSMSGSTAGGGNKFSHSDSIRMELGHISSDEAHIYNRNMINSNNKDPPKFKFVLSSSTHEFGTRRIINHDKVPGIYIDNSTGNSSGFYKLSVGLRYINMLTPFESVANEMVIKIKDDFPVMFHYNLMNDLGRIMVCIAPLMDPDS